MSKSAVILRSFHIKGDSRASKMIGDYKDNKINAKVVYWSRGQDVLELPDHFAFNGYGHLGGRFSNLWYFLRWHFFVCTWLIKNKNEYNIVHCVDFDTAIVGVPLSKILGKVVIFDSFDHFTSSRNISGFFRYIFDCIELLLCRWVNILILPDVSRLEQYGISKSDFKSSAKLVIIPNAPEFTTKIYSDRLYSKMAKTFVISYVGTLEKEHRGLEFIPKICKIFPNIHFHIAGNGELDSFFLKSSNELKNLFYHGYVPYEVGLRIMSDSDLIYGPYLLSSPNHHFASPNKMFEHLFLGKPLITNAGTPVESFVDKNKSGIIFDGGFEDLCFKITMLNKELCNQLGLNASKAWRSFYSKQRSNSVRELFSIIKNFN